MPWLRRATDIDQASDRLRRSEERLPRLASSWMTLMYVRALASRSTKKLCTNRLVSCQQLFDINEAFAAQWLAVQKELGLPNDKSNVFGGAIGEHATLCPTLSNALLNWGVLVFAVALQLSVTPWRLPARGSRATWCTT